MKKQIKEFIKLVLACLYYWILFFKNDRDQRIIINYHSIYSENCDNFNKQIAYIAKNFKSVTTLEIVKNTELSNAVTITFDDAFKNFIDNAHPILIQHGVVATIFVPTDYLGELPKWPMSKDYADHNEIIMTAEELLQLDQQGVELLSHTATHQKLNEIDDEKLDYELSHSKSALENILGHEILGIAYPHGNHDKNVCKKVRDVGYQYGFTIEPCFVKDAPDSTRIGRVSVSPNDSMLKFILKINGAYNYLDIIKRNLNKTKL